MCKLTCLILYAVTASVSSEYVNDDGPLVIEDIFNILLECAKVHNVSDKALEEVTNTKNLSIVNPCLWGCSLKKAGFIDEKGQYVLNPGLAYVRQFSKFNTDYPYLDTIALECNSVKNYAVSDGGAGCQMGALAAECFLKEYGKRKV